VTVPTFYVFVGCLSNEAFYTFIKYFFTSCCINTVLYVINSHSIANLLVCKELRIYRNALTTYLYKTQTLSFICYVETIYYGKVKTFTLLCDKFIFDDIFKFIRIIRVYKM